MTVFSYTESRSQPCHSSLSTLAFFRLGGCFPNGDRIGFPFRRRKAHAMSHDPPAILRLRQVIGILDFIEPFPANIEGDSRVIFRNIAKMICNGAANI